MADMEERVRLNYLLDFYGPLLTEHRQEVLRLYCEEDLTQQEIALQDRTENWKNTNALLHPQLETYIPATIGLKTGYTGDAGSCLLSAFFMEDRLLIIGVFGCPAYTEDRYLDTVELFNTTVI